MPGKITKFLAKVGDTVKVGTPIVAMEAMKMEHIIKAHKDGALSKMLYDIGDFVEAQNPVFEIK